MEIQADVQPIETPSPVRIPANANLRPLKVYSGAHGGAGDAEITLRIANGGAGQSGLIGALADAFIDYEIKVKKEAPFRVWFFLHCIFEKLTSAFELKIGWYLGDTTQSLEYVENRQVDVAITYNDAAEQASLRNGLSAERVYGFRDHFMLVGPK